MHTSSSLTQAEINKINTFAKPYALRLTQAQVESLKQVYLDKSIIWYESAHPDVIHVSYGWGRISSHTPLCFFLERKIRNVTVSGAEAYIKKHFSDNKYLTKEEVNSALHQVVRNILASGYVHFLIEDSARKLAQYFPGEAVFFKFPGTGYDINVLIKKTDGGEVSSTLENFIWQHFVALHNSDLHENTIEKVFRHYPHSILTCKKLADRLESQISSLAEGSWVHTLTSFKDASQLVNHFPTKQLWWCQAEDSKNPRAPLVLYRSFQQAGGINSQVFDLYDLPPTISLMNQQSQNSCLLSATSEIDTAVWLGKEDVATLAWEMLAQFEASDYVHRFSSRDQARGIIRLHPDQALLWVNEQTPHLLFLESNRVHMEHLAFNVFALQSKAPFLQWLQESYLHHLQLLSLDELEKYKNRTAVLVRKKLNKEGYVHILSDQEKAQKLIRFNQDKAIVWLKPTQLNLHLTELVEGRVITRDLTTHIRAHYPVYQGALQEAQVLTCLQNNICEKPLCPSTASQISESQSATITLELLQQGLSRSNPSIYSASV